MILSNPDIPCLCKQCSQLASANWSKSALFWFFFVNTASSNLAENKKWAWHLNLFSMERVTLTTLNKLRCHPNFSLSANQITLFLIFHQKVLEGIPSIRWFQWESMRYVLVLTKITFWKFSLRRFMTNWLMFSLFTQKMLSFPRKASYTDYNITIF